MLPIWLLVSVAGFGGALVSKAGPRVLSIYQEWVGDRLAPPVLAPPPTDAPSAPAPPTDVPPVRYAPGPRHPVAVDWIEAPQAPAPAGFGVAPGERYPAAPSPPGDRYPAAPPGYQVADESPLQGSPCAACAQDPTRPCSCGGH